MKSTTFMVDEADWINFTHKVGHRMASETLRQFVASYKEIKDSDDEETRSLFEKAAKLKPMVDEYARIQAVFSARKAKEAAEEMKRNIEEEARKKQAEEIMYNAARRKLLDDATYG